MADAVQPGKPATNIKRKKTTKMMAIIAAIVIVLFIIILVLVLTIGRSGGAGNAGAGGIPTPVPPEQPVPAPVVEPVPAPVPEPSQTPMVESFTYGEWNPWTECSTYEGEGVQKRVRYCTSGNCPTAVDVETQPCRQGQVCQNKWTSGTVSGTCSNCDWRRYFYGEGLSGWFFYCRADKDAMAAQFGYGEFN